MSDSAVVLVAMVDSPSETAARILERLSEDQIIEALPTDSALGKLGHRPGRKVLAVVKRLGKDYADFRKLWVNGLAFELCAGPTLFSDLDELPVLVCPACGAEIDGDRTIEIMARPSNPFLEPPTTSCARCRATRPTHAWIVKNGAFGNLAIHFWNWWPLKASFVRELEVLCGCALSQVHVHI